MALLCFLPRPALIFAPPPPSPGTPPQPWLAPSSQILLTSRGPVCTPRGPSGLTVEGEASLFSPPPFFGTSSSCIRPSSRMASIIPIE
jgi:hypothetical protein